MTDNLEKFRITNNNFNSKFKRYFKSFSLVIAGVILLTDVSHAQIESSTLSFNRGKLWESVYNGKIGPSFSNWRRSGIGLDWPAFDVSWINENIGGVPSYLLTGGFMIGCRKSNDSVYVVEDWSISGGTVSTEPGAKYKIIKHTKPYKNGENYWLKTNPDVGEEVIESVWEYNENYTDPFGVRHQLPVRVSRTAQMWDGSQRDENYVLYRYVVKNIADEVKARLQSSGDLGRVNTISDTLKEMYIMLNYAIHANSRSWNVLFPLDPPGAKNTWYFYDPSRKMIWGRAADYPPTKGRNEEYGLSYSQGIIKNGQPQGEWLAPGYVGVRLIYSTPNADNKETYVNGYGWSAGDQSFDFSGPFADRNTEESQYNVIKDPSNAPNFTMLPSDTVYMKKSRMWSMMSLGPWTLLPGDSVVFSVAEIVDGADYKYALDPNAASVIRSEGNKIFNRTADEAKFTYENNNNHPDPPAAPSFKVDFYGGSKQLVANEITWNDEAENISDPDDGVSDLVGYKVYKSSYLPIGPWDSVGTVIKGDPKYYDAATGNYALVDSNVQVGASYYYALTAYDSGRTVWNINPSAKFPETNSSRVPPLETSIYANKKVNPFVATLPPTNNLDNIVVVPNPFVIGQGRSQPGSTDRIQFINIPNPCTIRIYTVRGDLVKTINVEPGSGAIASWDQVTDYGQFVESGVYIYHIESGVGTKIGKLAIVR